MRESSYPLGHFIQSSSADAETFFQPEESCSQTEEIYASSSSAAAAFPEALVSRQQQFFTSLYDSDSLLSQTDLFSAFQRLLFIALHNQDYRAICFLLLGNMPVPGSNTAGEYTKKNFQVNQLVPEFHAAAIELNIRRWQSDYLSQFAHLSDDEIDLRAINHYLRCSGENTLCQNELEPLLDAIIKLKINFYWYPANGANFSEQEQRSLRQFFIDHYDRLQPEMPFSNINSFRQFCARVTREHSKAEERVNELQVDRLSPLVLFIADMEHELFVQRKAALKSLIKKFNLRVETDSSYSENEYAHFLLCDVGQEPDPGDRQCGFYLYRNADREVCALVIHNGGANERLNLTKIAKQQGVSQSEINNLHWPEAEDREVNLSAALVYLIASNFQHILNQYLNQLASKLRVLHQPRADETVIGESFWCGVVRATTATPDNETMVWNIYLLLKQLLHSVLPQDSFTITTNLLEILFEKSDSEFAFVFRMLLSLGFSVPASRLHSVDNEGNTLMHRLVYCQEYCSLAKLLMLDDGYTVFRTKQNNQGQTPWVILDLKFAMPQTAYELRQLGQMRQRGIGAAGDQMSLLDKQQIDFLLGMAAIPYSDFKRARDDNTLSSLEMSQFRQDAMQLFHDTDQQMAEMQRSYFFMRFFRWVRRASLSNEDEINMEYLKISGGVSHMRGDDRILLGSLVLASANCHLLGTRISNTRTRQEISAVTSRALSEAFYAVGVENFCNMARDVSFLHLVHTVKQTAQEKLEERSARLSAEQALRVERAAREQERSARERAHAAALEQERAAREQELALRQKLERELREERLAREQERARERAELEQERAERLQLEQRLKELSGIREQSSQGMVAQGGIFASSGERVTGPEAEADVTEQRRTDLGLSMER